MSSVTKKSGFAAPYRSQTFRLNYDEIVGRNGVMSMNGEVTESAGIISIPAFTFIQQGLIVTVNTVKTIAKPTSLPAPYFLVISSPTTANVDDLVLSFAAGPRDVQANEVLVAEWDGNEWRQLPFVAIDEVIKAMEQDRLDYGWGGPVSGLITSVSGLSYKNTAGIIIDRNGMKTRLDEDAYLTKYEDDPEATWLRVDRVVYRRQKDGDARVGVRKTLLGGTYTTGAQIITGPQVKTNSEYHPRTRVAVDKDNIGYVMTVEGFGASFSLWLTRLTADRSTVDFATTPVVGVTATTDEIDFAVDPVSGDCHFVYVNGGNIFFVRTDKNANVLNGPTAIDTQSQPCSNPRILRDSSGKFLITYQVLLAPSNNQLYFTSCDNTGSIITGAKRIVNTATNIINQDMFVTPDLYLYIAYEDQTLGKIYYNIYDDIGNAVNPSPVWLSQNVISTSYGTNTDNASKPKVRVSDSGDMFITFLQVRGGLTGIAVVKNQDQAYSPDLLTVGETFTDYDFQVSDLLNDLLFYVNEPTSGSYRAMISGEGSISQSAVVLNSEQVTTQAKSLAMIFDRTGSLLMSKTDADPGTYTDVDGPQTLAVIGPATLVGTNGTISLAANQIMFDTGSLTHTPVIGEQMTIAGATDPLNDGAQVVQNVQTANYNGTGDATIITVPVSYNSSEEPVVSATAQFAIPDGMAVNTFKASSELDQARALRKNTLPCDVLLSRILVPGPVILNYVQNPVFGGGTDALSLQFGVYGSSQIDWEATAAGTFTIASNFGIVDLFNNLDYQVQAGGYLMNEGDALYVTLDGANLNVTPQVRPISTLPWADPIQVLGFIKNGTFNPVLLGLGGGDEMDPGEIIIIGEDLPTPLRTRLGLLSDTSYEAYTSTIGIGAGDTYPQALSNLDLMAGQNKNVKLVKGGVWSAANAVPSGIDLTWTQDAYIQVTGLLELRNRIPAGSVNFPADGYVAYVNINRLTGPNADLTVVVDTIDAIVPTRDTVIIARRVGNDILAGDGTVRLAVGESQQLDSGMSNQSLSALGLVDEVDPGQLRILTVAGSTRIRITPTDRLVFDGTTWGNEISGLPMKFDGCQIDLQTGNYYSYDGLTLLGTAFTPTPFSAPNLYRWLSINLVPNAQNPDGTMAVRPLVFEGTAGTSPTSATKPAFTSKKLGRVVVHAQGSGSILFNVTQDTVVQLASGSGGGDGGSGGYPVDIIDLVTTALPSGPSATLDGVSLTNGMVVLFTQAPIAGVYTVSGVGTSIQFSPVPVNLGSNVPPTGFTISVRNGTTYFQTTWVKSNDGWRITDESRMTSEPTGWYDRTQSSIAFNNGTRTLTLTPSGTHFDFAQSGVVTRKVGAQNFQISNTEGLHFIYYDGGNLAEILSYSPDLIGKYVFVATVYWDATNSVGVIVGDERHGMTMDSQTHMYLHNTQGMKLESGFNMSNFTLAGDGSANADSELALSNGILWDEDLRHSVADGAANGYFTQDLAPKAMIPMLYQLNSGNWRKKAALDYPLNKVVAPPPSEITERDALGLTPNQVVTIDAGSTIIFQKVVVNQSGVIKDITLTVAKTGNPTAGLGVQVYSTSTQPPQFISGSPMTATGNIPAASISTSPGQVTVSLLTSNCHVHPGQEFWVLLYANGGGISPGNDYQIYFASSGGDVDNVMFTRIGGVFDYKTPGTELVWKMTLANQATQAIAYSNSGTTSGQRPFWEGTSHIFAHRFYFPGGGLQGIRVQLNTEGVSTTMDVQGSLYQDGGTQPGAFIANSNNTPSGITAATPFNGNLTFGGGSGLALPAGFYWFAVRPVGGNLAPGFGNRGLFGQVAPADSYVGQVFPFTSTDGGSNWVADTSSVMAGGVYFLPNITPGSDYVAWNQLSGSWQLTQVPDDQYVASWVFATNNFYEPVIAITGQRVDATLDDARANNTYESLTFNTLPSLEMKCLYRLIYKVNSSYTNASKAFLVDIKDYRKAADATLGNYIPSAHSQLGGLQNKDHGAAAIFTGPDNSTPPSYDGGLTASDDTVAEALETVNRLLGLLKLKPHPSINTRVVVTGADRILNSGQSLNFIVKKLLLSFDGAEIDFATGDVYASDGVTPLGINFTPFTVPNGEYFYYSVNLIAGAANANNTIGGQILVLPASGSDAVQADAPRPAFPATGTPLGYVWVQGTVSSIDAITHANLGQFATGVGAASAGDANSLMEDIKARLRDGPFLWATPNIISLQGKTLIDTVNSTATYDIANSWYDIDIGQSLRSIQQFGAQFLASTRDCADVEVNLGYDVTGIDPAPNVYVSRNGGNAWQQVTMDRVGASNKLRGSLTFATEANQVLSTYAIANADGTAILGNTIQAVAQPFTPASKVQLRKVSFSFTKAGSPIGNVNLKIIKDSAGSPSSNASDIVYSTIMSASSFAAGTNTRAIDVSTILLGGQTYWVVLDTDALYKTNNLGVDNIQVREDSSSPTATLAKQYNGSVWNTAVYSLVYIFEGITYDLRLRVDSTTNGSKLLGYGIFFGRQSAGTIVAGTPKQMRTTFSGSDNVYSFTLPFTPDPDFLRVYDVQSGQVYVYPTFDISGNVVTFLSGTFLVPGTSITLLFDQSMGTGYDNSDRNRALMAENGLGGQNGNDASSPGVGLKLRSANGQLWHIVVQDSGAILTTPITG